MKRKIYTLIAVTAFVLSATTAAQAQNISLPSPQKNGGKPLMETLENRHSQRAFSNKELSLQELSNVLWAGNGVNRDNGRRTAPSAVDARDIELYVSKDGKTYLYKPEENVLEKVSDNDFRSVLVGRNQFIMNAPVVLLLASNQANFTKRNFNGATSANFGYMDAGYVSQNVCLYCVSAGLGTVPCAPRIDAEGLQKTIGISADVLPVMYMPVGYSK